MAAHLSLAISICVGALAAAAPTVEAHGAQARVVDGGAKIDLAPALIVDPGAPGRARRLPFVWTADCGDAGCAATAEVDDEALRVRLRLDVPAGAAGATLAVDGTFKRATSIHLVAVELPLAAERATVIGRDLRASTARLAYLGRFDPKWIVLADHARPLATVIVDDALDGVTVKSDGKAVTLRLELDAAEARPFLHDAVCTAEWRMPNRHLPSPVRVRAADEKVSARVQLLLGARPAVVQSRWPDGRKAAFVITDHADQTSARTLAVLARGLIAHHLAITKSLFAHGSDRPQLERPEVVALADELAANGSEIVPHSATPKRDERAVTIAALDKFERWHTRTWIDHQPETNCEAFGDQGFHVGGHFGIADLLAGRGYEYVWAEDDAPPGDLNLSSPRRLDRRAPTVWPLGRLEPGGPAGLWMFRSQWAFLEARRFYAMYANDKLDKLERENGLHIAHTYLETYHPKRTVFGLRNLLVPVDKKGVPGGPGAVALDKRFAALLAALEARQARGALWMPTVGALGDRLRATAAVAITPRADGTIAVSAPAPVAGATFVVLAPATVDFGGHAPRGQRAERGVTVFWDDLPAGETIIGLANPGSEHVHR
jgi:hypothetical protein